jgi:hypothetical protein
MKQTKQKQKRLKFSIVYVLLLAMILLNGCVSTTPPTDGYNLTTVSNQTTYVAFFQQTNSELMFDTFGTLILLSAFFILTIAFIQTTGGSTIQAIAASSWICFSLSIMLRFLDLVPNLVVFSMLMIAGMSVALLKTT